MGYVSPPWNLQSDGPGYTSVVLRWTNTDAYDAIHVERQKQGESWQEVDEISGSAESYECAVETGNYYNFRVRGRIGTDYSDYSGVLQLLIPLAPPSGFSASTTGHTTADLAWTNGAATYTNIIVEFKKEDGAWIVHTDAVPGGNESYNFEGLEDGTRYSFRVRARRPATDSGPSNEDSDDTDLSEPVNLSVESMGYGCALSWALGNLTYASQELEYSFNGSDWNPDMTLDGQTTFVEHGLSEGVTWYFRVRGVKYSGPTLYSNYSNVVSILGFLPAPFNLEVSCVDKNSVHGTFREKCENEDGFKVYRDGSYIKSLGPNETEFDDAGLTPGTWYRYQVTAYKGSQESERSNEALVFTSDPPRAPSDGFCIAMSSSSLKVRWKDNSDNEVDFHVEESENGTSGWAELGTAPMNVTYYDRTGLGSDTLRYYRVRAHNVSGYSDYSPVFTGRTLAAVATPTDLVAYPAYAKIELLFTDNSEGEDGHKVERSETGTGDWAVVATLAPNVDYWADGTVSLEDTWYYRVRAYQGAQYSNYSNIASASPLDSPNAPTGLTITEKTDTTMRMTWVAPASQPAHLPVHGYLIQRSLNGVDYTEFARHYSLKCEFMAWGLSPGTLYYWKVQTFNEGYGGGTSSAASDTTLSAYVPTALENYLRNPTRPLLILCEINPKMTLQGFTLTSGKTYTYQLLISERRIKISEVWGNGESYTEKTNVADVESTAGSWWFDFYSRVLYVHTAGGEHPNNYFVEGGFWLYFSNMGTKDAPVIFNDNLYLSYLTSEDVGSTDNEISPYYEGNIVTGGGDIRLRNPREHPRAEGHYFDRKYALYTWRNRKVVLRVGAPDFSYSQFLLFTAGYIRDVAISDRDFELKFTDLRYGLHRDLPVNHYWPSDYPFIGENDIGRPIPILYGLKSDTAPTCIDATRKKFSYHDGRCYGATVVKRNDIELTKDTEWFDDPRRGIVTLHRDNVPFETGDIITVTFAGRRIQEPAGTYITNGVVAWKDALNNYLGVSDEEIDLDRLWQTKAAATQTISAILYKGETSENLIRTIEHSIKSYSYTDLTNRVGLRLFISEPESNVRYLPEHHIIGNFRQSKSLDSVFRGARVFHSEAPATQTWEVVDKDNRVMAWRYRIKKYLEIHTYLGEADALNLATDIVLTLLDKDFVEFTSSAFLFSCVVGDIIRFSRRRFFSAAGVADEIKIRLLSVTKNLPESMTCDVIGEVVP